jgi:hypothetical protein
VPFVRTWSGARRSCIHLFLSSSKHGQQDQTCWLSFRMTIILVSMNPAWFIASYAIPPVIAPSPMTAMQWFFRFCGQQTQTLRRGWGICPVYSYMHPSAVCIELYKEVPDRAAGASALIVYRTLKSRPTAMPSAADTEVEL